jgi:hypothetical protein
MKMNEMGRIGDEAETSSVLRESNESEEVLVEL